ncbi:MAG: hypothetical protein J7621_27030 [Niastella sp.]|jgi:hypothetical protein|nr:hypothetical protein [Niastella sp.]
MKKIFVLAATAMLLTSSFSYANNGGVKQDKEKCKKTCTKPCPKPCKDKCDKSKCAKA